MLPFHRGGLTWDGAIRMRYINGVEVARDEKSRGALTASNEGLYFGTGSKHDAGTYRSGLIDDVRLYDRAVKP